MSDTRRIAVFRALYLGDVLLAIPALRALRQHFPHAEISLIGLPWASSFVERYAAYLDRLVPFAGYPGIQEGEGGPEQMRAMIEEQRASHYDLVIQMHGSGLTSNAFVREIQGKVSVGYFPHEKNSAGESLTISAAYPEELHEIERNLGLVRLLGCTQLDPRLEFPLTAQDEQEARSLLGSLAHADRPLIGLHAGANYPSRRWPAASFVALANELANRLETQIVLTGIAREYAFIEEMRSALSASALNLAGKTSLGGLAALLCNLDLFICNDTGPAHLAYAVGTPSITLFGPGDERRWGPLDRERHAILSTPVACRPCSYKICPIDQHCLQRITPASVADLAERIVTMKRVRMSTAPGPA